MKRLHLRGASPADALYLAGAILIALGVALLSVPAGLIVLGIAVLVAAWALA